MTGSEATTQYLFSYGTLQLRPVQQALFGRHLTGAEDTLCGFRVVELAIHDESVVAISGKAIHTMATYTGQSSDMVDGMVFAVTPEEIEHADKYEVSAVRRVKVVLGSGLSAWTFIDAQCTAFS